MNIPPFVFFGTSRFSVILLEELKNKFDIVPDLIVTAPDRPVGRKQIITPPPVKEWAIENDISTFQPERLKDDLAGQADFMEELKQYELFVVASYGKIIPKAILDIPKLGTLNVHPSLLPKYRGASPIQSQIIENEQHVGTTIMLMDEEMDHGPIVAQKEILFAEGEFPDLYNNIEEKLAIGSASLFASAIETFISGKADIKDQDHEAATYTKIIEKADGEISLSSSSADAAGDSFKNYLKHLAYHEWPKTFFFFEKEGKKMRAVITEASYEDGAFLIKKVIPEGRNEMDYQSFLNMIG